MKRDARASVDKAKVPLKFAANEAHRVATPVFGNKVALIMCTRPRKTCDRDSPVTIIIRHDMRPLLMVPHTNDRHGRVSTMR
jgi:hypothetical protein